MKKTLISIGMILMITLPICTASTIDYNRKNPTNIANIDKSQGSQVIDPNNIEEFIKALEELEEIETKVIKHDEKVLWEDKTKNKFSEVSKITGQLIELEVKDTSTEQLSKTGFYIKWYKVTAKNTWGWAMFWVCARGYFIFFGGSIYILPYSYSGIDWWCGWAWERDYMQQSPIPGDGWGQIYAEAGFTHKAIGQHVDLWAYIKCFSNGQTEGDGGAL